MPVVLRELLPARRRSETFDMTFGGQNAAFSITLGFYADGRVGEAFIDGAKTGSEVAAVTHDAAVLISLALQYGVPLSVLRHTVGREADGAAASIAGAVLDRIEQHINKVGL